MPRPPRLSPYGAMLAESTRTGMPRTFQNDLTVHDRAWVEARDPALPFLWALRPDGTHVVGLEPAGPRVARENTAPAIFDALARDFEGSRFYIWDGVSLHAYASTEAARAAMRDLIEREAEAARDLAAKFCGSNPATPHDFSRGARCCFCEAPKP